MDKRKVMELAKEIATYRAWEEWNDAYMMLLDKRDREQRALVSLWRLEDLHKRELAQRRLAKVLEQIEAHEKNRVPFPCHL
jgi:beta-phosphoglucomutase-like phosphatase (HAD superfamily)